MDSLWEGPMRPGIEVKGVAGGAGGTRGSEARITATEPVVTDGLLAH